MKILITGGAGYIGATIASACADAGIETVILDDLSTGSPDHLVGRVAYVGDIADGALVDEILRDHPDVSAVIHCAARIVVPESVAEPTAYYATNVASTIALLTHLHRGGIHRVLFSSSASVYAGTEVGGITETAPLGPASPYARTKAMVENILEDAALAGELRAVALRYFNPIGVDPQRRTGLTTDEPTHVLGLLMRAWESGDVFTVTGVDWPTHDGSGLRDFIHVWDLARAHVAAIERFDDVTTDDRPYRVLNLGTGRGTTVRELAAAFTSVAGPGLTVAEGPRRPGDLAGGFAVASLAEAELDWRAELSIEQGIGDLLAWRADRRG